jgi:hypothetical protein
MDLLAGQQGGSTTLTDLFHFLNNLERDEEMVNVLRSKSKADVQNLENYLEQYPNLPNDIKQIIRDYQQNRPDDLYSSDQNQSYGTPSMTADEERQRYLEVADLLRPIKTACAGEIDRMWKELGIC